MPLCGFAFLFCLWIAATHCVSFVKAFQSSHFDTRMGSKMALLQKRSKTALFRVLCFVRAFGCLRSKSRYKTKLDPLAPIFDGSPRAAFRFALRTTKKPTIIASSSLSPVVARRSAPPLVKLFFCGWGFSVIAVWFNQVNSLLKTKCFSILRWMI